jgi:hypothetical protein
MPRTFQGGQSRQSAALHKAGVFGIVDHDARTRSETVTDRHTGEERTRLKQADRQMMEAKAEDLNKTELVGYALAKGLSSEGTKRELLERIQTYIRCL